MRLDDDVETTSAHIAVCAGEGEGEGGHDFCNADSGGAGDADAAVDECCGAFLLAGIYGQGLVSNGGWQEVGKLGKERETGRCTYELQTPLEFI